MATTALTLGRPHDSQKWETIKGPDVPLPIQIVAFRDFQGARTHPRFAEVQLWVSNEGISKKRILQPEQADPDPTGKPGKKKS